MLGCGEFCQVEFRLCPQAYSLMQISQKPRNSQALKLNPVLPDARQDKTRQNVRKTINTCFTTEILKENLVPPQPRKPLPSRGRNLSLDAMVPRSCGKDQGGHKGQGEWADLARDGRAGPMARTEPGTQIIIYPLVKHLLLMDVPTFQRGYIQQANTLKGFYSENQEEKV